MKCIICFICLLALLQFSCNNQTEGETKTPNSNKDALPKAVAAIDSSNKSPIENDKSPVTVKEISKEDKVFYKRAEKVKSYADFIKNYFKENSEQSTVVRLQGMPDVTEDLGQNKERWFYGECEVEFYYGKVTNVINGNDCLKFIPGYILLTSTDPKLNEIAKRFMDQESKRN